MDLIDAIDKTLGEVRTDSIDMSIGEIITLHESKELTIQPDFQRLFRWTYYQRSRLIESLLLQLPIPSIFVIEREDGTLELIDGLQRISSLIQFVNPHAIELEPLVLDGCDLVKELNGNTYEDLPLTIRLKLKRTAIRTIIIKRQSSQFLRYEMFKRLNTGGSKLSDQDIRNVNARMIGDIGADFYNFLIDCANYPNYKSTIDLLSQSSMEQRGDEELVLRFFASKNYISQFKGSITDWLDSYMEDILLERIMFDKNAEAQIFRELFDVLNDKFGSFGFVKYRHGQPIGSVAPAYYEAVTCGCLEELNKLRGLSAEHAVSVLSAVVQSEGFRNVTGPGANSLPKLRSRINLIAEAFAAA